MNRKIVLLPLDDRPCNRVFPQNLFGDDKVAFTVMQELGEKKTPARYDKIKEFLLRECRDAYGLVVSMDMLLYGGLLPSRLHHMQLEEIKERAKMLQQLRRENPDLLIYAFQTIMRCPTYSSNMEEPDYYGACGAEIYKTGELLHKQQMGIAFDEDLEGVRSKLVPGALEDYTTRRACNEAMDEEALLYVEEGVIDLLIFPQDDCSSYGFAAMDRLKIQKKIRELCLDEKVMTYPGADEVGMTLVARMINTLYGKRPKVYVKYASENVRQMIPLYEGSILGGTIRNHIYAAGCLQTDCWEMADIILGISAAGVMEEAISQPSWRVEYYAERNLGEFTDFLQEMIKERKIVTLADNAYANGGDLQLVQLLNKKGMLMELDGYAGWNTSANTLGTAIAESVAVYYQGKTDRHRHFMVERYLEDVGYCSVVRPSVSKEAAAMGMDGESLKEKYGTVSDMARKQLHQFKDEYLSSIANHVKIINLFMPWERMFEVEIWAEYQENGT